MIIYKTTNLITGEAYIGKDVNNDPFYLGSGKNLKRAIQEYGKSNFRKEILETCSTRQELDSRERYWIEFYDAQYSNLYYNLSKSSIGGSNKGRLWIKNPITEKFKLIDPSTLQEYLNSGWVKSVSPNLERSKSIGSTKGNKWIHDPVSGKIRNVKLEKVEEYLSHGWKLGLARELGCIKVK